MDNTTTHLIAKNIRRYLELNKKTQAELADALGVHASNVTLWLKEKTTPRPDMIDKICAYFKISKDELLRNPEEAAEIIAHSKTIPIYNSIYKKQYFDVSNIERYIAIDQSIKADFGIVVYSDSMAEAGIEPGDVAFFKKDFDFVNGRIYAVWITGNESVILKRVFESNNVYVLNSENTHIAPIVVSNNEAFIIGELFGIYKRWKWTDEKI